MKVLSRAFPGDPSCSHLVEIFSCPSWTTITHRFVSLTTFRTRLRLLQHSGLVIVILNVRCKCFQSEERSQNMTIPRARAVGLLKTTRTGRIQSNDYLPRSLPKGNSIVSRPSEFRKPMANLSRRGLPYSHPLISYPLPTYGLTPHRTPS